MYFSCRDPGISRRRHSERILGHWVELSLASIFDDPPSTLPLRAPGSLHSVRSSHLQLDWTCCWHLLIYGQRTHYSGWVLRSHVTPPPPKALTWARPPVRAIALFQTGVFISTSSDFMSQGINFTVELMIRKQRWWRGKVREGVGRGKGGLQERPLHLVSCDLLQGYSKENVFFGRDFFIRYFPSGENLIWNKSFSLTFSYTGSEIRRRCSFC